MDLDTADSNMMESYASAIPVTPLRGEEEVVECPPAPRRRARSPSEEAEGVAYDAAVRQLVGELTMRLDSLPAVEGLVSPSGLQRQQAFDPAAPRVCSPMVVGSPAELYVVGGGRQVSTEMDLVAAAAASPLKRRETDIESSIIDGCYGLSAGEAESDLSVAGPDADTNTSELPATSEGDESELEVSSDDDGDETEPMSEDLDGDQADTEDGGEETNTVEHVESEATDTNTSGLYLSFHRQKGSGELAVRLEAPVWMVGVLMSVVTAYMWMVVYLIKSR
jgi:hypothetical protein